MIQQTIMEYAVPTRSELDSLRTIRDRVLFIYNRHIGAVEDNKILFYYYRVYFETTVYSEETIARTGRAIRQANRRMLSVNKVVAKEQQRRACAKYWQQTV